MSWSSIQATQQGSANSSAARNLAFTSNVTAGNLLVVAIGTWGTNITVSVVDSQGNSYSQVGTYSRNGNPTGSLWVAIAGSSGANTVTVTPNATAYMGLGIAEYSGNASLSLLDATANNSGSGTALSTGSIPVNAPGELFLGLFTHGSGNYVFTPGAGFNLRCSVTNGVGNEAMFLIDEFPVSSATAGTGTLATSAVWASVGASIKAASGGPWPWFFDGFCAGSGRGMTGGMFG